MDIKIVLNYPRGDQTILIDFLLLPNLKKNKYVFSVLKLLSIVKKLIL